MEMSSRPVPPNDTKPHIYIYENNMILKDDLNNFSLIIQDIRRLDEHSRDYDFLTTGNGAINLR